MCRAFLPPTTSKSCTQVQGNSATSRCTPATWPSIHAPTMGVDSASSKVLRARVQDGREVEHSLHRNPGCGGHRQLGPADRIDGHPHRPHLLTDGRHIYLEDSARAVVDLLKNARQPMLSVCLSDTIQRVRAEVRGARKRSASVRHLTVRRSRLLERS